MPGLLRGMARTAVISGTATAVSNRVSRNQAERWANDNGQHYETESIQVSAQDDVYDQLAKLGQLKDQGVITQEEFDAKKKQLLGL